MEGYKIVSVNDVNTLSHTLICARQSLLEHLNLIILEGCVSFINMMRSLISL